MDADSAQAFARGVEETGWLKILLISALMGIAAGIYRRYQDKKSGEFGKPIISEESERRISEIGARATGWWTKTGQRHWSRWGIWVLIVLCAFIFLLGSDFVEGMWDGARGSFAKGYKAGRGTSESVEPSSTGFIIGLVVGIPALLFFGVLFGKAAGRIHYFLIYKPILRSYKTANVVLYFIMSLIIYNTFLADFVFVKIMDVSDNNKDMLAYAIWVFSLMFSIIYDYKKNEDTREALEKERNEAQIQALKAQINPHFLFNTLNNLYGTALVEESPKTAHGIQQLAQIMRHAVESSQQEYIDIGREIRFLDDYIELQKIRLPKRDNIRVHTHSSWDEEPATITPLILMTFVENAFKYGINLTQECFLDLTLTVEQKRLTFVCRNSVVARTQLERGTGMGVENTLKRLNLLYPDRHTVRINHSDEVYEVFLTIQLT